MSDYDSRADTYEHIGKVRRYVMQAVRILIDRANEHDASKLVPPEVEAFDRMTPLLATLTYGTSEYKQSLADLGPALEHHYAANSHHPEHHADGISGMTLLDLVEMLCDWYAASQRLRKPTPAAPGRAEAPAYDSDFGRSIALNQERFRYSDEMRAVLTNTAVELGFIASPVAAPSERPQ